MLGAADTPGLLRRLLARSPLFHLIFSVTNRCDQRCRVCFHWRQRNRRAAQELSLTEIERIAAGMPCFFWLQLTGGEPFARRDLPQICAAFIRENGVRQVSIPTNGSTPAAICAATEAIAGLHHRLSLNVSVSLHGVMQEHDALTGVPGSFQRAVRTARQLWRLRARQPNLSLGLILTQSAASEPRLLQTLGWLRDNLPADHITINLARGEPQDPTCLRCSPALYHRCSRLLSQASREGRAGWRRVPGARLLALNEQRVRHVIHETMLQQRWQTECFAGRLSYVLSPEGRLFPCELRQDCLGDLRANGYRFQRLTRSARSRQVRQRIAQQRCYCTHECFMTVNLLFNRHLYPWYALGYVRDWLDRLR